MDKETLKKLRKHYHALQSQDPILVKSEVGKDLVTDHVVEELERACSRLDSDFPSLVPKFEKERYRTSRSHGTTYYSMSGIRSYLAGDVRRFGRIRRKGAGHTYAT